MTQPLVVTGWSTLSPFGIGRTAFIDGFRAGDTAVQELDTERWPGPMIRAGVVPGFEVRDTLGAKGTRAMDRITGLAVKTVGLTLEQLSGTGLDDTTTALVLGTTTGSLQSMMEFVKDSFVQDKPFQVDPSRFPNAVMNRAAGQCAIWYGLRGPNATIAGGRAAGVLVLQYAQRLHRMGRARAVLCGMVEEYSEYRAWVDRKARGELDRPAGEGCAIFVLESPEDAAAGGRPILAELIGVQTGVWSDNAAVEDVLTRQLRVLLSGAGITAQQVHSVIVSGSTEVVPQCDLSTSELKSVGKNLGAARVLTIVDLTGDVGAATAGLQLGALLTVDADATQPYVVMTSVDQDGLVGAILLRLPVGVSS